MLFKVSLICIVCSKCRRTSKDLATSFAMWPQVGDKVHVNNKAMSCELPFL